jgi:hypothetical protein
MRCEQVTRELATPSGRIAPGDLAAHLAECPACASWSSRAASLDRAWEMTRPDDLPAEALDALWAAAAIALDSAPASIPMPRRARYRSGWARAAIGLATAAAILGPIYVMTRPATAPESPEPRPSVATRALPRVEIGVDETVVIRIGADGPRVDVLDDFGATSPDAFPSLADATPHDVMNALESLAQ